jgi:hypothetical protein
MNQFIVTVESPHGKDIRIEVWAVTLCGAADQITAQAPMAVIVGIAQIGTRMFPV